MRRISITAGLLSWLLIPMVAAAALAGLFWQDLYRHDSPYIRPQAWGQDLVTLLLALPAFAASLVLAMRGSLRGRLLWLGLLAYLFYTYASYSFLSAYNQLFLLYVACFSAAFFAFFFALASINPDEVKARLAGGPRWSTAIFILLACGGLAAMWLATIIGPLMQGRLPELLTMSRTTTLVIQALDLGLVVPLGLITCVLLARNLALGYVLAPVLLTKAAALGLAILSMILFMLLNRQPVEPAQAAFMVALAALALLFIYLFLRRVAPERPSFPLGS